MSNTNVASVIVPSVVSAEKAHDNAPEAFAAPKGVDGKFLSKVAVERAEQAREGVRAARSATDCKKDAARKAKRILSQLAWLRAIGEDGEISPEMEAAERAIDRA